MLLNIGLIWLFSVYLEGLIVKLNSTYHLQDDFKDSHVAVASITILLTLNPIPNGHGRNQPIYERHVTTAGRNRVKAEK